MILLEACKALYTVGISGWTVRRNVDKAGRNSLVSLISLFGNLQNEHSRPNSCGSFLSGSSGTVVRPISGKVI